MTHQLLEVQLEAGCIHLRYWPRGSQVVLALHGFGQDGSAFAGLVPYLSDCTLYAPDLPFHGHTRWQKNQYEPSELAALTQAVLDHSGQSELILLGYSLGGRLALALTPALSSRIRRLVLLAPDGIGTSQPWLIHCLPAFLRRALVGTAHSWERLPVWADRFHKRGWISTPAYRYFLRHWQHESQRIALVRTWLSLALFPLNRQIILLSMANSAKPPSLAVVLGTKDPLVDQAAVELFFEGVASCQLVKVDARHDLLACPDKWYHYVPVPKLTDEL